VTPSELPDKLYFKIGEVARLVGVKPYVLRYWETEFSALSEGKDKGATKLYTARDVKIISRIRQLLYDEGFTVAGAKKRLDAEIAEGRFDGKQASAPPISEPKKPPPATPQPVRPPTPPVSAAPAAPPAPARSDFDRQRVIKELKEIVRLLHR
jgi:DNA-binding transcriptional MerR regulator